MAAQRTPQEQEAYDLGLQNHRRGLTLKESDLLVARRWGIHNNLLDAATDGWYEEEPE